MRNLGGGDGDKEKTGGQGGNGHREDMNSGWQQCLAMQLSTCQGYKKKFKQPANGPDGFHLMVTYILRTLSS